MPNYSYSLFNAEEHNILQELNQWVRIAIYRWRWWSRQSYFFFFFSLGASRTCFPFFGALKDLTRSEEQKKLGSFLVISSFENFPKTRERNPGLNWCNCSIDETICSEGSPRRERLLKIMWVLLIERAQSNLRRLRKRNEIRRGVFVEQGWVVESYFDQSVNRE